MSERYISRLIREKVAKRAGYTCEYCLQHEDDSLITYQIEHIISLKHGGSSELANLAYSCIFCNKNKGSDVGTILLPNEDFVRFYNPRKDDWFIHFEIENAVIKPRTKIGKATIKILSLNLPDRILERQLLIELGRYPFLNNH